MIAFLLFEFLFFIELLLLNKDNKSSLLIKLFFILPDKNNSIYELYGVVVHMKIFSGGHYYALCKNNNRWLKFNDDDIEFDVDPIDKNAYILLYKKKNCN